MAVHPKNADIAFAAVLGHAFGPNSERGVYRTTDGGKTWKRVLFKDDDTGASDVCIDPNNPRVLFAGLLAGAAAAVGTDQRRPRQRPVRLARRRRHVDAARNARSPQAEGTKRKRNGLPRRHLGQGRRRRRAVRLAARLRHDRGREGRAVPLRRRRRELVARQRHAAASPAGLVLLARSRFIRPTPTWSSAPQRAAARRASTAARRSAASQGLHHGDHHDLWIDPEEPEPHDRLPTTAAWTSPPTAASRGSRRRCRSAQFYHVIDATPDVPYRVMGCMQDLGTRQRAEPFAQVRRHRRWRLVRCRRRRGRLCLRRPVRPEHRLRRRVRRHHDPLRPPHRPGAEHHASTSTTRRASTRRR